jgi:hypothetical protein
MAEPRLYFEGCDNLVLSSIEFNRGSGCYIVISFCHAVYISAIKFEQVSSDKDRATLIDISGSQTRVAISGLSLQTLYLSVPTSANVVRARQGSVVRLIDINVNFDLTTVRRHIAQFGVVKSLQGILSVVDSDRNSSIRLGNIGYFDDGPVTLISPDTDTDRISFAYSNAYTASLPSIAGSHRAHLIIAQSGTIVKFALNAPEGTSGSLTLVHISSRPTIRTKVLEVNFLSGDQRAISLERAFSKSGEYLRVAAGGLIAISLTTSGIAFDPDASLYISLVVAS